MARVIYVNGRYQAYAEAMIHVEDRGFQFADAVYEVIEVSGCALIDEDRHMERLARSLDELDMSAPMSAKALAHVIRQTIKRNRVVDGIVYLQVSRGQAPRDFCYSKQNLKPTLICIARSQSKEAVEARAQGGIKVITTSDLRWRRCDIKSVMLLPACLAKAEADRSGAAEAWLVDDEGFVTEGASSNAWIVDDAGRLITRQADSSILRGVTRMTALSAAESVTGLVVEERAFTVAEAYTAQEAFVTSASATIMPVVAIDGRPVGAGRPGPVTLQLRSVFHQFASLSTGK